MILIVGGAFRIWLSPYTHHVYFDEFTHFDIALKWTTPDKSASIARHMPGWSFLLSLVFFIFGKHVTVAFTFSSVLSILSILLVYVFIRGFFREGNAPLWGALITAVLPLHLRFSASMDTDQISFFFLVFSLVALSFYIRDRGWRQLAFLLTAGIWSSYIRQENVVFLFLALISIIIVEIKPVRAGEVNECSDRGMVHRKCLSRVMARKAKFGIVFLLSGLALLPFYLQNLLGLRQSIYGHYYIEQGVSAGLGERMLLNFAYFFQNTSHPLFLTVMAMIGAAGLLMTKGKRHLVAATAYWFIGYFFIYLFIEGHFK